MGLCVRWRPIPPKRGRSPQFSAHVYCSQTAGWINMPLGMGVGLSPGDFVLDGNPAHLPTKGVEPPPQFSAHFYCGQTAGCIKRPLGMEVDLIQGDFVLDGTHPPPSQKGGGARGWSSPIFGPCLLWPNGWMDEDNTWHGGRPWSSPHCARWGHSSAPKKGDRAPNFWPIFIVAKRLDASRCHLVWR